MTDPFASLSSTSLETARLDAEAALQAQVVSRFGLDAALDEIPESAVIEEERAQLARRAMLCRVTRSTAPDLYAHADQVLERLGLETELELLIDPSEQINAEAFPVPSGEGVPVVALTSGSVRRLSPEQLRCVIGHELAHIAYGHADLTRALRLVYRDTETPELLDSRLRVLSRLQELSADRVGALAVDLDLLTAARTELLVASGLGPEHVGLDLPSYVEELHQLEGHGIPHHLFQLTHPLLPIRVRALQLFCEGAPDEQVLEAVRLMDYESVSPSARHQRNVLVAGGLIAAHADGDAELDEAEREQLVELVLPFSDDPEGDLARVQSIDEAVELFTESARWIRENAGPERFELLQKLIEVTLCDGELAENEVEFLVDAGTHLDIPEPWIRERLRKHEEDVARAPGAPRMFGLSR